jgi:hypothetical protein
MPKGRAGGSRSVAVSCLGPDVLPYNDVECRCGEFCIASIWSTPKNPGNHARQLRRVVDNCLRNKQRKMGDTE